MSVIDTHKEPSKALIFAAFAGLYIIWGSTYLAIRIALEHIPPFFLVATRFFIAGGILLAWCLYKGEKFPSFKSFYTIGLGGVLMLFLGNGAVSWAEQYIPSGLTAIIVATVPLWFVLLDKSHWKYYFSNKIIVLGILIGFGGVLMLFAGKGSIGLSGDKMRLLSFGVLLIGTIGWATGSLYSKYKEVDGSVTMKAAVQMLAAAIVSTLVGFISNEQSKLNIHSITIESGMAMVYLIMMGSLVGYMSYIWLLSVRPASVVGTYAYVNPVVAVFLGLLILNEPITSSQLVALLVILVGVILVNLKKEDTKVPVEEAG
jgi:drug/metabolite transporter (DMT)-like permease